MCRVLLVLAVFAALSGASVADDAVVCLDSGKVQKADVDGPVLSARDLGPGRGDGGRYRIVVRDRFTGCRIGDNTNSICKVGQHASIIGGSLGLWTGEDKNADSDYPYLQKHIWDCE
ncbi:MAG: hypothetical protein JOZ55_03055 [Alphaproteobacteria bacterium]|nr:hypothetical protein [Alphaproteobacteria bacterium]